MTNKEREVLQKFIDNAVDYRRESTELFNKLEDLNKSEGTGCQWMSAKRNYEDLVRCGKDYGYLYAKYVEANAKCDLLIDLGLALAELDSDNEEEKINTWKKSLKNDLLKMGLHEDRLQQMLKSWHGDIEQVYTVVEDWGVELCNKGYDTFDYDGLGLLEIEAIIDVDAFDDDEAVNHAIADGVKIIPVEELPEKFDKKFLGWIDTPENRRNILEYVDKYCR